MNDEKSGGLLFAELIFPVGKLYSLLQRILRKHLLDGSSMAMGVKRTLPTNLPIIYYSPRTIGRRLIVHHSSIFRE